jgi:hypothetical protein
MTKASYRRGDELASMAQQQFAADQRDRDQEREDVAALQAESGLSLRHRHEHDEKRRANQ